MTVQRQPNPLWVDKALRQHWAAMQERVGKRWMPIPSSTTPKQSPLLPYAKRARGFYEWGTGRYGTVLPTRDPKVVVKVTSDKSEIEFILRAEQLHHWPDGIVRYYRLVQLGRDRSRQVYAVWREAAYAVGVIIHDAEYAMRKLKINHATFSRGVGLLDNFYKAARTVQHAISRRAKAPKSWEALPEISQDLSTVPGFSAIGQALSFYLDHGIVLADVHANNVGLANRRNKSVMVITDPGHALFVDHRAQKAANP